MLIADDEELITKATQKFFARYGLKVFVVHDGVEAVEVFKKHQHEISLVVVDLRMPRMNGIEAFSFIKKLNSNTIGILTSGFGEDIDIAELQRIGFKEFVRKPFNFEELSRIFEKYVLPRKKESAPFFG